MLPGVTLGYGDVGSYVGVNTAVTRVFDPNWSVVVYTYVVGPTWPGVDDVYPIGPPPPSSLLLVLVDVPVVLETMVDKTDVCVGTPLKSAR